MDTFTKIKQDFPIYTHNPDLVYLDSTATSLKPAAVINKLSEYYGEYSANVHRGIYQISEKATAEYEETREAVAAFINANKSSEVVFTRGTTEGLNLIASTLGQEIVSEGDEVVTSLMEHHSNFVPWQQLAFKKKAKFVVIPVTDNGELEPIQKYVTAKTKIIALTLVSNILGTINPLKEIFVVARQINPEIICVVDAAQAAPHLKVDVQDLGCDFLTFSSHKMLGPTGVGVLWGKYQLLDEMEPYQYGGNMIMEVAVGNTTFKKPPHKFEAGTPHIGGIIAFKEAIRYLESVGMDNVREHEKLITKYAINRLTEVFGEKIHIYGPKNIDQRGGIVAFTFDSFHPHDIAQILDEDKVAIRAGHHCGMPLHTHLNVSATARASFYIYNDETDVDKLCEGLKKVQKVLTRT